MIGSWPSEELPKLNDNNCLVTSPKTRAYNCIGWAADDFCNWWWPNEEGYWPPGIPVKETIEAFITAFATRGYEKCDDGNLEDGIEKVALFIDETTNKPTHAARQLDNGHWTSKIGRFEDIVHTTLEAIDGYGKPIQFLKRKRGVAS